MVMDSGLAETKREEDEGKFVKGVRHLCESGITKVPHKYILPVPERPEPREEMISNPKLKLPIIDLALLDTPDRSQVLQTMANSCVEYGFFQVVNHGIDRELISRMVDVGKRFFELPLEETEKYMSSDIRAPVRYGTSLNQLKDGVLFWRDFLKLICHPLENVLQQWPTSPMDLREVAASYAKQTKSLFLILMSLILENLGIDDNRKHDDDFDDGTHMMVLNCYPACPEPDLTFLTLLLQQDAVHGLQVQCKGEWVTVEPVPGSIVVNVGDHLEIFSNGKYKSVLHRVLVNSSRSRISVASLHSLPYDTMVSPLPELVNDKNPKLYKDTDFASFLNFISSSETKHKNFLETRKLKNETK
ncbi:protein DMR6-LIKE OXYGENASE 2 [Asparagus officinalis]|uniref:protein DMR6-LIKE OXYGENASE 2 n=1 Tax=Asparagus officinalis TaxID=4686 RepID=UPI00098E78EB|nr:protein DMR6-LIKE OXYGENASE 2 [Asparagus officinalis]